LFYVVSFLKCVVTEVVDVIKFPANLENQTKITFILGVLSIVSELLKFCKMSEVLPRYIKRRTTFVLSLSPRRRWHFVLQNLATLL